MLHNLDDEEAKTQKAKLSLRCRDCRMLSPKWGIYPTPPPPNAQEPFWRRNWKDSKKQTQWIDTLGNSVL